MICEQLDVYDTGFQKRNLKVFEFLPINNMCIQINIQFFYKIPDIRYSYFRIPSVIQMNSQWSKAMKLDKVGNIRAVYPSA